jgi:hypothetical protein
VGGNVLSGTLDARSVAQPVEGVHNVIMSGLVGCLKFAVKIVLCVVSACCATAALAGLCGCVGIYGAKSVGEERSGEAFGEVCVGRARFVRGIKGESA